MLNSFTDVLYFFRNNIKKIIIEINWLNTINGKLIKLNIAEIKFNNTGIINNIKYFFWGLLVNAIKYINDIISVKPYK